jgi:hypothetical protein
MLNLLVLHRELVCSDLHAFDLVNIPRLPLSNLGVLTKQDNPIENDDDNDYD